jgi:hypothetical protein
MRRTRKSVLTHKLPVTEGLDGVKPPPLLQVTYDARPYRNAALRWLVPTPGSARAPVAALPATSHPVLRVQAHRVGIRIDASALGVAALLRRARTPSLDRLEAVEVGAGPGEA